MTLDDQRALVALCKHPDYRYEVLTEHGIPFLRVAPTDGRDLATGEPLDWSGRKWRLSLHMTDGEVVQTVFKATMTAIEHETRERFTFWERAVFGPHFNIYALVHLCDEGKTLERDHA